MATIKTDSPSTGKTIPLLVNNISNDANQPTILWECNDFAVPLREEGEEIIVVEVDGEERQLADGEALFITPLTIANKKQEPANVSLKIKDPVLGEFDYVTAVYIPGLETVQIGINGLSLVKNKNPRALGEIGPQLLISGSNAADPIQDIELTAVAIISEAEAGTHAPAFEGIF